MLFREDTYIFSFYDQFNGNLLSNVAFHTIRDGGLDMPISRVCYQLDKLARMGSHSTNWGSISVPIQTHNSPPIEIFVHSIPGPFVLVSGEMGFQEFALSIHFSFNETISKSNQLIAKTCEGVVI